MNNNPFNYNEPSMTSRLSDLLMATALIDSLNEDDRAAYFADGGIPKKRAEAPIPNGCAKYTFDDFSCVASSEKAALKKYAKWLDKQRALRGK